MWKKYAPILKIFTQEYYKDLLKRMRNDRVNQNHQKWLHLILLCSWILLGIALRWTNLAEKSASSIEIATLGYSLGHSFFDLPLDRVISLDQLLSPLQFESTSTPTDVIHHLLGEDNHPPLYFVLNHLWFNLFSTDGELVSLWVGRSLSAIFGVIAIPAIFALGCLAFSPLIGHIAAALMAISPYGIYLAQESRHYTLTILWIIASVTCLTAIMPYLQKRKIFPIWLGSLWVIINSLGISTHYFFALALTAEGLVIGWFWLRDIQNLFQRYWWRVYLVALGTLISGLVWWPIVGGIGNSQLTDWISTSFEVDEIWYPIPRLLGWVLTMVWLLPIEGTSLFVTILSGVTLLIMLVWVAPGLLRGGKAQINDIDNRFSFQVFLGFFVGAIALFLLIIYGMGKDLSLAARYHFVYFPIVIILLAAILGKCWDNLENQAEGENVFSGKEKGFQFFQLRDFLQRLGSGKIKGERATKKDLISANLKLINKRVVVVVLLMGLCGGLTVVSNYGYQKSRRADFLVEEIKRQSKNPSLIATTYQTHAEIRALIALGMEFKRQEEKINISDFFQPQFLLIKRQQEQRLTSDSALAKFLSQTPRPLDLWAVNLKVEGSDLETFNCRKYSNSLPKIN
ncbi:glycosyltransferase family 39 protein, partial [Okeania sp. SIO1I7]|uniref:glycosyltransferase family 39 protein n=1 Tax=Okeania sp. SIO1I7 TaxID=2607772 RepID=UPI0025E7E141